MRVDFTLLLSLLFAFIPFQTLLREQARNQNSMYMRQLSDLESTVSQLRSELREAKRMYEDKVRSDLAVHTLFCTDSVPNF